MKTIGVLLLITALAPAFSFASNIDMNGQEDCSNRVNQRTALEDYICRTSPENCGNIHKVGLVGQESRKAVPTDPNNRITQLAEGTGIVDNCGKGAGSLTLVEYNNKHYLVGAAHGFYNEDGSRKCDKNPTFYPDFHYANSQNPPHDPFKGHTVQMPPINEADARTYADRSQIPEGKLDRRNLNDFVIFAVDSNSPMLKTQRGTERTAISIANFQRENSQKITSNNQTFLIADHKNFNNGMTTAVEANCSLRNSQNFSSQLSNCDTGHGSSGAPLLTLAQDNKPYISGIIQGDTGSDYISDDDFEKESGGSVIIPLEQIRSQFEKHIGPENRAPESYQERRSSQGQSA